MEGDAKEMAWLQAAAINGSYPKVAFSSVLPQPDRQLCQV